jgi:Tfp pilus assembly protein PilV
MRFLRATDQSCSRALKMQQSSNQYKGVAAMPNAAATDGPPRTDEARPSVASVRINVPSFYQFIRSLRSKVFVTFV